MEIKLRKTMKFVVLLLTALLIGTASVAAYTEMFMHGNNITIGTAGVKFVAGDDTATLGSINSQGTEVTFNTIPNIEPGATVTYNEAVNITNTAGSVKTINVSLYSLTGQWTSNFDYITLKIIALNNTVLGSALNITTSTTNVTSSGNIRMNNGETWAVQWIIKAKTGATNGQAITVVFKVKVE
jgi:hypothetical protein